MQWGVGVACGVWGVGCWVSGVGCWVSGAGCEFWDPAWNVGGGGLLGSSAMGSWRWLGQVSGMCATHAWYAWLMHATLLFHLQLRAGLESRN